MPVISVCDSAAGCRGFDSKCFIFDCSYNGTSHLLCEPLLGLVGGDSLELAELSSGVLSVGNSLSSSGQDHVEVHTEDTGVGIILDSQINMLFNTETEVAY